MTVIAVIGCHDAGDAFEESPEFDRVAKSVDGLTLCNGEFPIGEEFPVHIFTHQHEWISGHAARWAEPGATLFVKTKPTVPGGTSGSAIVNDNGEVVGIGRATEPPFRTK